MIPKKKKCKKAKWLSKEALQIAWKRTALNSQQICKTHYWPQDWKRSVFFPIPKKGNAKECSNYHTIAFISHASKVMFKILQGRFQVYITMNFQMFKLDLEKAKESEIKLPTSGGSS